MKVSILSAVHNEALYVDDMIDSVQAQSHEDWELVFVSDGSTDATVDVIRARAAEDPRIVVVGDGAKLGKVAAFNRAFAASQGDLIVLLAGDDTWVAGSLATRVRMFDDVDPTRDRVVAYFKLQTMSDRAAHDGVVLPKGASASHSGGTISMTRNLADVVFPVEDSLVSEDLWLTRAAEGMAREVREFQDVVLNYRIHAGNSNPRNKPFVEMSAAIAQRHRVWRLLLAEPRFTFDEKGRAELTTLMRLEELRREGDVCGLLRIKEARFQDRAAYAAMASPRLFAVRRRFFRLLSGRRAR